MRRVMKLGSYADDLQLSGAGREGKAGSGGSLEPPGRLLTRFRLRADFSMAVTPRLFLLPS